MVTLAVAAVMIGIALPALGEFVQNNRRATAVNEFIAAANVARAEALRRASRMTLCRTDDPTSSTPSCGSGTGWEEGWIIFNDTANFGTWNAGEEIIKVSQKLGGDITLRGNSTVANSFGFSASGELATTSGTWVFCDSRGYSINDVRELTIWNTGRLRIKDLQPPVSEAGLGTCTP